MAPTATAPWLAPDVVTEVSKEVTSGRYVNVSKLEERKEHRFRFFGTGITGFEVWTVGGKPIRYPFKPETAQLPDDVRVDENGPSLKRFIAGLVYDYAADDFKVMLLTQKGLMNMLFKCMQDPDYGDPVNYDIKISRKGSGLNTEYTLVPSPPKDPALSLTTRYEDLYCNLEALFANKDPFEKPQG